MTAIRRSLRDDERELLLALVERDQNRSYLVQQIAGISQVEDWNDGTNTITLALGSNYRSRIYALADDEDGASIDITLFARGDIL